MEGKTYQSVGQPVRKKDAMALLLGKPAYVDDVTPRDCLVVKVLRSPHAHALIEEIDDELFISKRTVDKHRANILEKTGCKNTASLVVYAIRHGIVEI